MMPRLAVIQFPGSNCEYETQSAARHFGFDAQIIRWNDTTGAIDDAQAIVVPGGFSFQDRVRAGAIAARLPIIQKLIDADQQGKLILGICNGCQILAEAGLFPNFEEKYQVEAALAPNIKNEKYIGHICEWVYVKVKNTKKSLFTRGFDEGEILPIIISHGEGRFVLTPQAASQVESLVQLSYCTQDGEILTEYPTNPNGTHHNIAGLSNPRGNVLGMMPHPERAVFMRQVADQLPSPWLQQKRSDLIDGPWARLFISMRDAFEKVSV